MSDLIDRLKARWASDGLTLRPGASATTLEAFEAKYQVALPSAFRDYFAAVDGTGEFMVSGDWCFRFWPIDEVVPISEYFWQKPGQDAGVDGWFLFADHLIEAIHYAIRLTPNHPSKIAILNGIQFKSFASTYQFLTSSFESFLELYLTDEKNLF